MTPATRRHAVRHLTQQHGMSERRACKATGFSRMSMRYQAQRRDDGVLRCGRKNWPMNAGGLATGVCYAAS